MHLSPHEELADKAEKIVVELRTMITYLNEEGKKRYGTEGPSIMLDRLDSLIGQL